MPDETISDEEVLLRRIPSGKPWSEPPDRISSFNFKLRKGEVGLSVYRERFISGEELLQKPGAIEGSFVVRTTAGELRKAKNGKGELLNLDVIPVGHETNPGHAELRPARPVDFQYSRVSKAIVQAMIAIPLVFERGWQLPPLSQGARTRSGFQRAGTVF